MQGQAARQLNHDLVFIDCCFECCFLFVFLTVVFCLVFISMYPVVCRQDHPQNDMNVMLSSVESCIYCVMLVISKKNSVSLLLIWS